MRVKRTQKNVACRTQKKAVPNPACDKIKSNFRMSNFGIDVLIQYLLIKLAKHGLCHGFSKIPPLFYFILFLFLYFFGRWPLFRTTIQFLQCTVQYYSMWPFFRCCCRLPLFLAALLLLIASAALLQLLLLLLCCCSGLPSCCSFLLRAALAAPLQGLPLAAPLLLLLLLLLQILGRTIVCIAVLPCPCPGSKSRSHHWH